MAKQALRIRKDAYGQFLGQDRLAATAIAALADVPDAPALPATLALPGALGPVPAAKAGPAAVARPGRNTAATRAETTSEAAVRLVGDHEVEKAIVTEAAPTAVQTHYDILADLFDSLYQTGRLHQAQVSCAQRKSIQ